MSMPSKIILSFCAAMLGAWFLFAVLLNGVFVPGGFLLLYAVLFIPPLFFLLFAGVLVWAGIDLARFVNRRTPVNVGLAILGLIGLLAAAWRWYVNVASARGPLP
jgi:hypothetical protein